VRVNTSLLDVIEPPAHEEGKKVPNGRIWAITHRH
jgi:hypothetical protein